MQHSRQAACRGGTMRLLELLLIVLATNSLATAEPAWQKDLTSPAAGDHPPLAPCLLDFQVTWNGILDSGKLRMEFAPRDAKKPAAYVVRSSATSIGLAAGLFPYQSNFWSELDPASFKPLVFKAEETDRKETTTSRTRHFTDRVEFQETTQSLATSATTQKNRVFKFSPVFDIFSAMLHIRSQKLDDGDSIKLVVHPFGTPYLLHADVRAHELHLDRKTIRLSVGMRKIDRNTLDLLPYKKMKKDATIWLSDDAERIPVELRAAVFIGDIRVTLTGHQKL
ncbi:MAG: DUF3108 domain-containing protein [Verrucomicrobia bacterium]|nr:DUF3108 domain-containing protein [Verrucomicrobiota bacterium]